MLEFKDLFKIFLLILYCEKEVSFNRKENRWISNFLFLQIDIAMLYNYAYNYMLKYLKSKYEWMIYINYKLYSYLMINSIDKCLKYKVESFSEWKLEKSKDEGGFKIYYMVVSILSIILVLQFILKYF